MQKPRVLIAEDDEVFQVVLKEKLDALEYKVTDVVSTGLNAISSVGKEIPGVVLMDINLGGMLDGIHAGSRILYQYDVPVVYMTAVAKQDIMLRLKSSDPYGLLIKPFDDYQLLFALDVAMFRHESVKRIRTENAIYSSLLNSVNTAYVACTFTNDIYYVNWQFEKLSGWNAEELINLRATEFISFSANSSYPNGSLARKDGSLVPVAVHFGDISDKSGKLIGRFYRLDQSIY